MSLLHPMFQDIFAEFGIKPEPIEMQNYRAALRNMDWQFEYSDDPMTYRQGRDKLADLRQQQVTLDPDAKLWNEYAHPDYRIAPMTPQQQYAALEAMADATDHF